MTINNDITIEIYDGTTRIPDISNDLEHAEGIQFTAHIPGGDYGDASFFVERDVADPILFEIGHRVVFLNDQTVVYEGFLCGLTRIVEADYQGIEFSFCGATDWYLMKYPLEKRWADSRVGEDVWIWIEAAAAALKCDIDRQSRLLFVPKNVAWASSDRAGVTSTQPVGQTVKRVVFTYDLTTTAGCPNWTLLLRSNPSSPSTEWSVNRTSAGSSTGSADVTLASPHAGIQFVLQADAAYTPPNDGTVYGKITSLMVYSETDDPITMTTIAQDIAAEVGAAGYLNTSTALIETAGTQLTLEPFVTNGYPSVADILNDASGRGDGAYNRWMWGCKDSYSVHGANGLPVLYLKAYPLTTDWEYEVTLGDDNIGGGVELFQDGIAIANHVITSRTDENGRYIYYTPADDANLADAASKSAYRVLSGARLDTGDCTQAEATAYARRFIATYSEPPYKLLRPLILIEYVRRKDGSEIPVRLIKPGERIRLNNFVSTLSGVEPVFVITALAHSIDGESVSITTGVPGAPIGARQVLRPVSADPGNASGGGATVAENTGSGSGGSSSKRKDWYIDYAKVNKIKSIREAQLKWQSMSQAERNNWKKTDWRNWNKTKEKKKKK